MLIICKGTILLKSRSSALFTSIVNVTIFVSGTFGKFDVTLYVKTAPEKCIESEKPKNSVFLNLNKLQLTLYVMVRINKAITIAGQ